MGVLNFDGVRQLGLALPDVVEGTAYGGPALKLRGKLLACIPTNKAAEADSLVVHIDLEHRAELLRQHPDTYYITDHYAPHPTVLVRLSKISRTDLRELLRDACRFVMTSSTKAAVLPAGAPGPTGSSRTHARPGHRPAQSPPHRRRR